MIDDALAPPLPEHCDKCRSTFVELAPGSMRCAGCGKHADRPVLSRHRMRRRNIGGKRGRNSGKVSSHGKK